MSYEAYVFNQGPVLYAPMTSGAIESDLQLSDVTYEQAFTDAVTPFMFSGPGLAGEDDSLSECIDATVPLPPVDWSGFTFEVWFDSPGEALLGPFYLDGDADTGMVAIEDVSFNIEPIEGQNHVALVSDGTDVTCYLNGVAIDTAPVSTQTIEGDIGIDFSGGLLAHLAVFDRPLSASEIGDHYELGTDGYVTVNVTDDLGVQLEDVDVDGYVPDGTIVTVTILE